jgi:hypothetical protein
MLGSFYWLLESTGPSGDPTDKVIRNDHSQEIINNPPLIRILLISKKTNPKWNHQKESRKLQSPEKEDVENNKLSQNWIVLLKITSKLNSKNGDEWAMMNDSFEK